MRLDLHIHSSASDGRLPPASVVEAAVRGGLQVISLTDHDTTSGVEPARAAAAGTGLTVLAGTELSSTWEGRDVHVLGYGLDPGHEAMARHEARARRGRRERMAAMVEGLRRAGVGVGMDDVLRAAGGDETVLGRPHLARALVERGVVGSVDQAFDTLIGDHHPAFVPTELADPGEVVETILEAGGLPVWAHPPQDLLADLLPPMIAAGLRGLEVFRPGWSPARQRRVAEVARKAGLLITGGSDWHDPDRSGSLGAFWVPARRVPGFVEAVGLETA